MSCGVGHRYSSDPALLWSWSMPAAIDLILPLACEPPYAIGVALNRGEKKNPKMRYYLTMVRMATIKKSTNNKSWRESGEKGTLLHCWWECKLVQPLWKTVWRFLRTLKIELPYEPAIPLLDYPDQTIIQKDTCTLMFITVLFTIAKTWK